MVMARFDQLEGLLTRLDDSTRGGGERHGGEGPVGPAGKLPPIHSIQTTGHRGGRREDRAAQLRASGCGFIGLAAGGTAGKKAGRALGTAVVVELCSVCSGRPLCSRV